MEVTLDSCNLEMSDLYASHWTEVNLRNGDLGYSDLRYSLGVIVDLSGTNLWQTNLSESVFHRVNFQSTVLSHALLDSASFFECDFRQADLRDIKKWRAIKSMLHSNVYGLRDAPKGFREFALASGAVEAESDSMWTRMVKQDGRGWSINIETPNKRKPWLFYK